MQISPESFQCRIVIIGDTSVGKTSILNQLIEQTFQEYEQSTVGANYQLYVEEIDGKKVEIQIWDTAGQEKFKSLGPIYYRNARGAAVVFDVTNRHTFDDLTEWITAFTEVAGTDTAIFIVANQIDRADARQVDSDEVKKWADSNDYKVFETSAKTGVGIKELFHEIATEILKNFVSNAKQTQNAEPYEGEKKCSC